MRKISKVLAVLLAALMLTTMTTAWQKNDVDDLDVILAVPIPIAAMAAPVKMEPAGNDDTRLRQQWYRSKRHWR